MAFRVAKPSSRHASPLDQRRQQSTGGTVLLSPKSSLSASTCRSYADPVQLTPRRRQEMLDRAKRLEDDVERTITTWEPRAHKKGLSYYVDDSVGKGLTRFCCKGRTAVAVEEIVKLFVATDAPTLKRNLSVVHRNVQDAKVLAVLQPATRANPLRTVYVRHTSFSLPMLLPERHICVCVSTNLESKPDGSTVGSCVWSPVEIPEWRERPDATLCTKVWQSGFFFWRPRRPSARTRVCYLVCAETGSFAPQVAGKYLMNVFGSDCRRLCQHFLRRQLDPTTFASRANWALKSRVPRCSCCDGSFSVLSKRYNCESCGHVACRDCVSKELVNVLEMVARVRICIHCRRHAGMLRQQTPRFKARDSLETGCSFVAAVHDVLCRDSTNDP